MSATTETVVELPDFFIALVLPDDDTPTEDETEELRRQTVQFWNQQLGATYNNVVSKPKKKTTKKSTKTASVTFEGIDLVVKDAIFGPRVGSDLPDVVLDDRFNVCLTLGGGATFAVSGSRTKKPPFGNDIFRKMVAGDSMDYLCRFVKNQNEEDAGTNSNNGTGAYARASEVCARRLREDPDDKAFVVRTPTFFIALATDPYDDEEARDPTAAEVLELQRRTRDRIEYHIREDYPGTLLDCTLSLVRSEARSAKPDDRFQLYSEHDATATFSDDPPTSEELFALVMRCANAGFARYMKSLRQMKGTPYVAVTMMSIQIVELEDQPEPQPLEELPPPPQSLPPAKEESESSEDEEKGSGDEEEEDEEGSKPKEPPPPPPPPPTAPPPKELVTRKVPVFLALVVSVDPPAELPTVENLKEFEHLVLRFFYTVLKNKYPGTLVDMTLAEKETVRFDSGIPEPRFNMCVEYEATIRFKGDDPPEKKELKKLVLKVNLGTLLYHVKDLDPLCFAKATEISMRKKPKKQKPEKQKIKDAAFEASVDVELLEPPPPPDETKDILAAIAAAKEAAKTNAEAEKKIPASEETAEEKLQDAKTEEKTAKKKAEERLAKKRAEKEAAEEAARKKAEDEAAKKMAEEEANAAAEAKAVEDAAARARQETSPKLKKKKKKPKKENNPPKERTPPSSNGAPESNPSDDASIRRLRTAEVYTAFKLNYCKANPSDEEYEKLRQNTEAFFTKRLEKEFGSKMGGVRLGIHHKEFGAEKPEKHFNVYVEWDIEATYKTDDATLASVSADRQEHTIGDTERVPSPETLTRILVKQTDLMDYLVKAVQPIRKTAFANVTMGFMGAKVTTKTTF